MISEATFKFETGQCVPEVEKVDWTFIADNGIDCLDQKDLAAIRESIANSKNTDTLLDALRTFYKDDYMSIYRTLKCGFRDIKNGGY